VFEVFKTKKSLISRDFFLPRPWQIDFNHPSTDIMEGIIDLHHDIFFFLILISFFVSWMLFIIVFTFRSNNGVHFKSSRLPSQIIHNTELEIVWTIIPCIILLFIAVPSFTLLYQMDDVTDIDMTIKIIGNQWFWRYEYDIDAGFTIDQRLWVEGGKYGNDADILSNPRLLKVNAGILVPAQVNIRLLITSADVLHSWALPSAGIKVDSCPGRLNEVFLRVDRECWIYGQCSEICGINHAFMPIKIEVISPYDFDFTDWDTDPEKEAFMSELEWMETEDTVLESWIRDYIHRRIRKKYLHNVKFVTRD